MLAGALAELTAKGYAGDLMADSGVPLSPVPFAVALAADPKTGPSNELGLRAMRAHVEGVGRIVDDAPGATPNT